MEFSIREARQEDYEGLCELFAELDAFHHMALPHVFREPAGPVRTREFISAIISDGNSALFVAEHADQIIGLVHILIRQALHIPIMVPRRYAVIDALGVKKKFRRSGVGRSLVERSHQWALNKKVSQVQLNVWEFNERAIAFYEKLGYRTASRKMWRSLR